MGRGLTSSGWLGRPQWVQASSLGSSSDLPESSESLPASLSSFWPPSSSSSPPSLGLRLLERMLDQRGRRCLRLPWKQQILSRGSRGMRG